MLALQADAENAGALFAFGSEIVAGQTVASGIVLRVCSDDGTESEFEVNTVVNCSGLWAPHIAACLHGLDQSYTPTAYFAKGNYYSLGGSAPFSHLIYPVPEVGRLGCAPYARLGQPGPLWSRRGMDKQPRRRTRLHS